MNCPQCDGELGFTVMDDKEDSIYKHLIELCAYCGYMKTYVDYEDD